MPDLPYLRSEIERMRYQIGRQRKEIRALQRAGIPTKAAEELLERMLVKVDGAVRRARPPAQGAAGQVSGHQQAHQGSRRAAHPVSVYRRILRGADISTPIGSRFRKRSAWARNTRI
ncbi:hypothetical protein GGQ85_003366 [Nitrobacter vulgaris]|nr:hypothetical protein [Nitrobacter vulgaris]